MQSKEQYHITRNQKIFYSQIITLFFQKNVQPQCFSDPLFFLNLIIILLQKEDTMGVSFYI